MRRVRWVALLALALAAGMAEARLDYRGAAGGWRPGMLLALGWVAASGVGVEGVLALALCGFLSDAFVGMRMGSATMLFTLVGWGRIWWRRRFAMGGAERMGMAALAGFLVEWGRPTLERGDVWRLASAAGIGNGLWGAATMVILVPVFGWLFGAGPFRLWNEESLLLGMKRA